MEEKMMSGLRNDQVEKSGVGGWLLLLCIGLTIGSPLKTLYNLITSYNAVYPLFDLFPGLKTMTYIDIFLSVGLMIFSMRAGIAL